MRAIAVLIEGRAPVPPLPQSSRTNLGFRRCRSAEDLERTLQTRLSEAILLDAKTARALDLTGIRTRYPAIPIVIAGRLRPEDAGLLLRWDELGVAFVLVEGIDHAVTGDQLVRHTASHRRVAELAEFPRLLRLSEKLQLQAWECLVASGGPGLRTAELARALQVSREHLSRQFAAGGAPTLKQVADLLRVLTALSLFQNPGYDARAVARLLGLASASHLHQVVWRVTGARLAEVRALGPRDVLRRFLRKRGISVPNRPTAQPPNRPTA